MWIKELDSNKEKLKLVLNYYKSKVNGDENKRKVLFNNEKELMKIFGDILVSLINSIKNRIKNIFYF